MYVVIKLVSLLLIADTVNAKLDRGSVFLHEHGMLLREHGLLFLDTSSSYLSVFVNLAIPAFTVDVPTGCSNRIIKGVIEADRNARSIASKLVDRHDQLLSLDNSHEKSKRSIAAALGIGLGVFNLIFTGVAEYKVSKHIREVEQQFNDFKTKQTYVNEKFVKKNSFRSRPRFETTFHQCKKHGMHASNVIATTSLPGAYKQVV